MVTIKNEIKVLVAIRNYGGTASLLYLSLKLGYKKDYVSKIIRSLITKELVHPFIQVRISSRKTQLIPYFPNNELQKLKRAAENEETLKKLYQRYLDEQLKKARLAKILQDRQLAKQCKHVITSFEKFKTTYLETIENLQKRGLPQKNAKVHTVAISEKGTKLLNLINEKARCTLQSLVSRNENVIEIIKTLEQCVKDTYKSFLKEECHENKQDAIFNKTLGMETGNKNRYGNESPGRESAVNAAN